MYKSVLQLIEKERSQNPLYCFWTAKNHIQRNDGKTVFNNQFTETFEEQKDNEILVGKREISKEDHLGLECVDSKQEFVNVNVSDTIEGRKKLRSAEQILESESNEISNKPEIYKPSDTGSGSIVKLNEIVETDETDYFDSEDEYWDTQSSEKKRREDMANYLHPSTNVPKEGRYSIAVERFINLPFLKRSIRNFAVGNSFEVHDVISDGECLFRAIADQFLINGCPGHTETTLRQTAIKHLRTKYLGKDGSHHTSFLSGETSEEYLARMESPGEWGDHISLQALADVFTLKIVVFNVYQDDIRRTEVIAEFSEQIKKRPMTIYLGHLGEFYYLSLRPKHWQLHWPYSIAVSLTSMFKRSKHSPKRQTAKYAITAIYSKK
ncbi:uncharacterized protein LOC133187980 [Saccostrea echinata]|uniref:uncharacterized protein LOC133187980 n=1 Tax=Saccostrea echinata TaxID=191078 RepID=UPI002A8283AF|nr:uncharacterized protein LOC133187980 [Saccostrea echinata]